MQGRGRSTDIHYAPQLSIKIKYEKTILKLHVNTMSFPMTVNFCELPHLLHEVGEADIYVPSIQFITHDGDGPSPLLTTTFSSLVSSVGVTEVCLNLPTLSISHQRKVTSLKPTYFKHAQKGMWMRYMDVKVCIPMLWRL